MVATAIQWSANVRLARQFSDDTRGDVCGDADCPTASGLYAPS